MAKKKNIFVNWYGKTFGRTFNIWDVVILAIIIGYGWYIYSTQGTAGILSLVGDSLFYGLVIAFFVNALIKKAKK